MNELSDKNKLVIDRLFVNGFDRVEAYQSQYTDAQDKYAHISAYQLLRKPLAKAYYKVKHDEFKEAFNIQFYETEFINVKACGDFFSQIIDSTPSDFL